MNIARILAACSLAFGVADIASAVNNPGAPYIIYVSGSTAFRGQFVAGEVAAASAGITVANGFVGNEVPGVGTFTSSYTAKDAYTIVHGVDANNDEICYVNHWTGSVAGLVDLAQANSIAYIPLGAANANVPAITHPGTVLVNLPITDSQAAMLAMADCAESDGATTLLSTGHNGQATLAGNAINSNAMTDAGIVAGPHHFVSTVDFEWVMGKNAAAAPAITNITQDNAEALVTGGVLPAQYLTGNAADNATGVFLVGRNEDSGTRVLTQSESWGYGTGNKFGLGAATQQFMIKQAGAGYPANVSYTSNLPTEGANIVDFQPWPANWGMNTKPAISWSALLPGHSGYNGGGDVAAVLLSPNPVAGTPGLAAYTSPITGLAYTKQVFVTCIGTSDGSGLAALAGNPLTYNGVTYHKANIENGTYPLWNFEHAYYLTGTQSNSVTHIANGAAIQGALDLAADGVWNSGLGASDTDAGICGATAVTFKPITNRGPTAGSYIQ